MIKHRSLPMLGQLAHLQADVVDSTLDFRLPVFEGCGHMLQHVNLRVLRDLEVSELALPLVVRLGEARLPLVVSLGEVCLLLGLQIFEVLGEGVDDDFCLRVHGSLAALKSCEVVMARNQL